jgi:PHD/YefM family antitoxin component YafN of YafNO toxin-antitoxin module
VITCPRSSLGSSVITSGSITRNGHDAVVIISPEDLAQLEETVSVLDDPDTLADIREADAAYARDDVLRGIDAIRALRR